MTVLITQLTEWLLVICNIFPPHIWRKKSGRREWSKYLSNTSLPLRHIKQLVSRQATDNAVKWIKTFAIQLG